MVLFLDFDGVLHPFSPTNREGAKDFGLLPQLEGVLREYPHVEVVITSTRRLTTLLVGLRRAFSADIAKRVIGVTPSMPFLNLSIGQRQVEIEAWLRGKGRETEPWVALDDRADLFQPDAPLILCCNGITDTEIGQLSAQLSSGR